jgi:hypothetical protein
MNNFRNLVFSLAVLAALVGACAAQEGRNFPTSNTQPKLIFYGGDVNPDDPNAYAFANGNTLAVLAQTYGCVSIPYTKSFYVSGFLFNIVANVQSGMIFDPMTATYDVRRTIGTGHGGLDVKSGTAALTLTPTGRMPFGETEYSAVIMLPGALKVDAGGAWCINVTPQCTDQANPLCSQVEFFVDNTTQRTNAINPKVELPQYLWVYSTALGYNWDNWCSLGLNAEQCAYLSFGIYGY